MVNGSLLINILSKWTILVMGDTGTAVWIPASGFCSGRPYCRKPKLIWRHLTKTSPSLTDSLGENVQGGKEIKKKPGRSARFFYES